MSSEDQLKQLRIKFGSLKRYVTLHTCHYLPFAQLTMSYCFVSIFLFHLCFCVLCIFSSQFKKKQLPSGGLPCRIRKEIASYEKEASAQQKQISDLESSGADTADVNKQKEVLAETASMIPECEARMKDAQADVEAILAGASDELKANDIYRDAMEAIQELGGSVDEMEEEDL